MPTRVAAPGRFLIVRLSAIGDTIHTLPLAAAVKKAYPDCFLGWVVEKPASPLIVGNPALDWTYVLPKGWLKSWARVNELRAALKKQRFEVAFDVQGLSKSAVAAALSGAPVRVGFARGIAREIAPFLDNRLVRPTAPHVIDQTLSLLSVLGEQHPGAPEFPLPPCPADEAEQVADFIGACDFPAGFCLMGPWSTYAAKCWPVERYVELAERLRRETGLVSLLLGRGPAERGAVERAIAARPGGCARPAADLSLLGVIELARRARLFVGGDSFPTHAAGAVGTPTISLFAVTSPDRVKPYGGRHRAVFEKLVVVRSSREGRALDQTNMKSLSVEKVLSACLEALKNGSPS